MNFLLAHWGDVLMGLSLSSVAASVVTAAMPTPRPGSRWAALYHAIEVWALVIGRAKETGELPATPQFDQIAGEIAAVVKPAP